MVDIKGLSLLQEPVRFSIAELDLLTLPTYTVREGVTKETADLAQRERRRISLKLADDFEKGSEETIQDDWKAYTYRKKAGLQPDAPGSMLLNPESYFAFHGWFTSFRLFLVRLGRILTRVGFAVLPPFFSLFGLSYGIGLAINLITVLGIVFKPKLSPYEKEKFSPSAEKISFYNLLKIGWLRLKNALRDDGMLYLLLNDSIWFAVNLIVLCTSGPLFLIINPALNLFGFAFDAVHEFSWFGSDANKYTAVMGKLFKLIELKKEELQKNPADESLKKDIEKLQFMYEEMRLKRKEVIRRRLWISVCTALILIGMVMVYFPPTTVPGAFLIGSGLALGAGSVLTGLGRRFFLKAYEYGCNWWEKKQPAPSPTTDENTSKGEACTNSDQLMTNIMLAAKTQGIDTGKQPLIRTRLVGSAAEILNSVSDNGSQGENKDATDEPLVSVPEQTNPITSEPELLGESNPPPVASHNSPTEHGISSPYLFVIPGKNSIHPIPLEPFFEPPQNAVQVH